MHKNSVPEAARGSLVVGSFAGRPGRRPGLINPPKPARVTPTAHSDQPGKPAKPATNGAREAVKPANGAPPPPSSPKPPSATIDLGPRLLDAYRLLDAAGVWFEKLATELEEILGKIGNASEFSFLQASDEPDMDRYTGGEGWVLDGWRWTFPTRHRKQRIGTLSVVADIGRPGRPAAIVGEPCMLVMWSSAAHDWASTVDWAKAFWPPHFGTTGLLDGRVFHWTGKVAGNGPADMMSLRQGAWFFVVRLGALKDLPSLRTLIVQPALALLGGMQVETVFAAAPDVMRFRRLQNEFALDA
jgi:hypothetical protein